MSRSWRILLGICGLLFLAAILFPVFQSGHWDDTRRKQSFCQSNMKQLGLALIQYSQDNDECLPSVETSDSNGWREAVYPFVKSTGVYHCPEDKRDNSKAAPDHLPKSYAANVLCLSSSEKKRTVSDLLPTAILAADTRGFNGEDWSMTDPAFGPDNGRKLYAHFPSHAFYNHPPGRLNVLLADGHVKWVEPMETLAPDNLWTRDNLPFTGKDLANAQAIVKHAESE